MLGNIYSCIYKTQVNSHNEFNMFFCDAKLQEILPRVPILNKVIRCGKKILLKCKWVEISSKLFYRDCSF